MGTSKQHPSPEIELMRKQLTKLLEDAISRLPDAFRTVFVLREVEGLSVEETSEALQLRPETVRTRLRRAHHRLRAALDPEFKAALSDVSRFAGADCEAMTDRVMRRLSSRSEEGMH